MTWVVMSEVQRLVYVGSLRMRSTAYAQQHAHKAVLCGLVVCYGLLAKWLRVRAGARECTSCTFPPRLAICKCGEDLSSLVRYTVSVSARDGLLMGIQ